MKKYVKRLLPFALILVLMLSMFTTAASAVSDTEEELEWVLSEDWDRMSYGDKTFEYYRLPYNTQFRPYNFYEYSQSIEIDTEANGEPYTKYYSLGRPILYVDEDGVIRTCRDFICMYSSAYDNEGLRGAYVDDNGKAILDYFAAGNYTSYWLTSKQDRMLDNYSSEIGESVVQWWNSSTDYELMETAELWDYSCYEVLGYDVTLTFAHAVGAVFESNGVYYYVYYDALGNECFDAYGNLSFREGTEAPVLRLSQEDAAMLKTAIENNEEWLNVTYESNDIEDPWIGMLFAVILAIPFTVVLPGILLVASVVLAILPKRRVPGRARWIAVAALSALWQVLGVVIPIALLVLSIVMS